VKKMAIPADFERKDCLLAGLTARQLVILVVPGIALWAAYLGTRELLPLPVFAALASPVAAIALMLGLGRRDGLPADRLALAALRQLRSPRRLVPAPEGLPPAPSWLPRKAGPTLAPLQLPVRGIGAEGVIDLGPEGAALVCSATSVNFALLTEPEQEAAVAVFGRFLNSGTASFQVLCRAEPADLREAVVALEEAAGGLPHPALEAAAREHAGFLDELASRRDVLRRQILVVFREPKASTEAANALLRRATEAASALAAARIALTPLSREEAAGLLARATDPQARSRSISSAGTTGIVTRRQGL
jgi:hypothetical protein